MKGYLLFIVAVLLFVVLAPIGFAYGLMFQIGNYLHEIAISIDQTGNVVMRHLFNDLLITKNGYKFGDRDETISSVIGKNERDKTLKFAGKALNWVLNKIEANHSIKSIEENP